MNCKNCFLIFRSKKINNFDRSNSVITLFSAEGIYFDRIEYCAYDDMEEIARSIRECKGAYRNVVILCPCAMEQTLKNYAEKVFEGQFDNFGILNTQDCSLFSLTTEGNGRLTEPDIISIISSQSGERRGRSYVKTVGASTAEINAAISKAKEICPDCDFNVTDSFSDCTIEIVYPESLSKTQHDLVVRTILGALNDNVYAIENLSLEERLFQLLQLRRMTVSVAESFTGGGVSKRLVSVSGISEVFFEGINTYSNESKMKRLGVTELTLKQHGAVSENTAYEMAEGLLKTGDCDVAIATTGIAGPKSDSTSKPVGLIYIAVGTEESISVYKYNLNGNRKTITETAINLALFHAFKKLK